jgi:hypothetical protein
MLKKANVWTSDLSSSPVLIPLFWHFMIGFNKLWWDHMAGESACPTRQLLWCSLSDSDGWWVSLSHYQLLWCSLPDSDRWWVSLSHSPTIVMFNVRFRWLVSQLFPLANYCEDYSQIQSCSVLHNSGQMLPCFMQSDSPRITEFTAWFQKVFMFYEK